MKKYSLLILILVIEINFRFNALSQDIHFSQFYSSPLTLNPALTGRFDGAYRFVGNGRQQWRSVTIPYQSYGGSLDAKGLNKLKGLGYGLSVYNDRTGDSRYNTFLINLALSYTFKISKDSTLFLTLGAQTGATQTKIDYSNLRYDNQYNGFQYDPNIPTSESFANTGKLNFNLNSGILVTKELKGRSSISTGFSLNNVNNPQKSFFNAADIKLDRRFNINLSSVFMLAKKVDLLPSILFMSQGKFTEFTGGTSARYIISDKPEKYKAIYIGFWSRIVDAGIITAGMDYENLYVGLSYDINYSSLTPASRSRGAVEMSVIYIIKELPGKRKKYKICPTYI